MVDTTSLCNIGKFINYCNNLFQKISTHGYEKGGNKSKQEKNCNKQRNKIIMDMLMLMKSKIYIYTIYMYLTHIHHTCNGYSVIDMDI